ncbi:MAG: hypothetical protein P4M11_07845 [Candidatus Pacebacteria bacterium]|nr:hypothetical protein [Candidatus Paceibacterota bacterium]
MIHQDGEGKRNFYFLDSNNIPFLHVGPEGSYAAALDYVPFLRINSAR